MLHRGRPPAEQLSDQGVTCKFPPTVVLRVGVRIRRRTISQPSLSAKQSDFMKLLAPAGRARSGVGPAFSSVLSYATVRAKTRDRLRGRARKHLRRHFAERCAYRNLHDLPSLQILVIPPSEHLGQGPPRPLKRAIRAFAGGANRRRRRRRGRANRNCRRRRGVTRRRL